MLDLYSDLTMVSAQTGLHVEVLEIGDLEKLVADVTDADVRAKRDEIETLFEISGDSPADPIARRPTDGADGLGLPRRCRAGTPCPRA